MREITFRFWKLTQNSTSDLSSCPRLPRPPRNRITKSRNASSDRHFEIPDQHDSNKDECRSETKERNRGCHEAKMPRLVFKGDEARDGKRGEKKNQGTPKNIFEKP